MIDRLFTAILTITLLVGGTVAIGSALVGNTPEADQRMVRLPAVHVVGKSVASAPAAPATAQLAQASSARVQ